MSSAAGGGYGAVPGDGVEQQHHHQHGHAGHLLLHHHPQHVTGASTVAGGQVYHVPQHSRREKLRFPAEAADSPPPHGPQQYGVWPPPPAFYSYASSSSSYSPHSPTLAQAQLVVHGLAPPVPQIPPESFSLSLSSTSSKPPPQPRRPLGGPVQATGSFGPFIGYATVLGRSRFLGPAEKLLEKICDVGGAAAHVDRTTSDEGLLDADPMDSSDAVDHADRASADGGPMSGAEQQWKKTRLISMMEEVCRRYRQYYHQVQAVMASFENVPGFSNAAPFAPLALRAMAKQFKCLKSMILNQLRNTSNKPAVKDGLNNKDVTVFGFAGGSAGAGAGFQRGNPSAYGQAQNIWRPQRGLPERAVSVLRAWLFEHFLHPYPTDGDKQMLAKQTGLTRNQVSNWFINARVRLWKPMVEEIHNLEMRQMHKHSLEEIHNLGMRQSHKNLALDNGQHGIHHQAEHLSQGSGKASDPSDSHPGQSSSITRNHNTVGSQGFPDELSQMSHSIQEQVNFAYNGPSSQHNIASPHQQQQVASVGVGGGGNAGVSLTLGLHQNNRVCIAEPLPTSLPPNLAHRFGLDDVSDAYVMGTFGGQDRHFGKQIGGHLLHDFVG